MMNWQAKQLNNGKWTCENDNLDTVDLRWDSEDGAIAWATETNERVAAKFAELRARDAERAAARKEQYKSFPTQALTSRGDGWESNG